jgi:hypothetical protein
MPDLNSDPCGGIERIQPQRKVHLIVEYLSFPVFSSTDRNRPIESSTRDRAHTASLPLLYFRVHTGTQQVNHSRLTELRECRIQICPDSQPIFQISCCVP